MSSYTLPAVVQPEPIAANEVVLIASGDLRESANRMCWPAQSRMEAAIIQAFEAEGVKVKRAHSYDPERGHGFISSQRMGMDVFTRIHPDAPIVVAEAVWQYSHNVLAGLQHHRGPILTVANWSGEWPGLVGMLNLNACLHKSGVRFSTLWSEDFQDTFFFRGIRQWLKEHRIDHDNRHVRTLDPAELPKSERELGIALARHIAFRRVVLGVFDEGCMGMYNAIVEDSLMNRSGFYKERLSQSALLAEMRLVQSTEAHAVRGWLDSRGLDFVTGRDEATELTDSQIHEQCKMYIAAVRMAHRFGCDAIGIQYQQGLAESVPASDLVEGLLNNLERPPVFGTDGKELYAGVPLPHFNEVDECAGIDAVVTNRVLTAMHLDPATTLHDVRWGEHYQDQRLNDFVWVFQISGAVPPSHIHGGYARAQSMRQPPMYFRLGGGTLKGICKPGPVVWSRVFVENDSLHVDIGRATAVELPEKETKRRWSLTTHQWPLMHAVIHGVTRDQFMARHRSNHVNVSYAPTDEEANKVLAAKAAMFHELGIAVQLCGV